MTPLSGHPASAAATSIQLAGGLDAPRRARQSILSQLDGPATHSRASDAALVVSELVTNSVRHAHVGTDESLTVELKTLDDRVRISVIDSGSELEPRLLPPNPRVSGGFGLLLVNELSTDWGVLHDAGGSTRVWCELLLDHEESPRRASRTPTASAPASSLPQRL
jgi:anti-sigma regulatory factor (Ser/Thr protein kinase)